MTLRFGRYGKITGPTAFPIRANCIATIAASKKPQVHALSPGPHRKATHRAVTLGGFRRASAVREAVRWVDRQGLQASPIQPSPSAARAATRPTCARPAS